MENNYKENLKILLEDFSEYNSENIQEISLKDYVKNVLNYSEEDFQKILKEIKEDESRAM